MKLHSLVLNLTFYMLLIVINKENQVQEIIKRELYMRIQMKRKMEYFGAIFRYR